MRGYLVRRILSSTWALVGVVFVVFVLSNLSGDPAALMVPADAPDSEAVLASLRRELGYDRPVWAQFLIALKRVAVGNFGESIRERRPALDVVLERLPRTLALTGLALGFAVLVGIPIGVLSARKRGRAADRFAMTVSLLGLTVPSFWLSLILILLFAQWLRWLPAFGGGSVKHVILPALALAPYSAAVIARLTRSSMLEVLGSDYVRTARGKGLSETVVVWRHALKNAAIPVLTVLGLRAGVLLSGSIVVETVFAYPGAGQLVMQAVQWRDLPVVTTFVILFASAVIILNLATDLAYVYLDPRLRPAAASD